METKDILGIIGLGFGGITLVFCVYLLSLSGWTGNIIEAAFLGLFVALLFILVTGVCVAGIILSIISTAKRSKYGYVGFLLSVAGFLWMYIPVFISLASA
jgi:hypothetical protein